MATTILTLAGSALGGPTQQDFDFGVGQTYYTVATGASGAGPRIVDGSLLLFGSDGSTLGEANAIAFDRSASGVFNRIEASWSMKVGPAGTSAPERGCAFSFLNVAEYGATGPMTTASLAFEAPSLRNTFSVAFHPATGTIALYWNLSLISETASPVNYADGAFHPVTITAEFVSGGARATVTIDGQTVFNKFLIAGMASYENRAAFAGRGAHSTVDAIYPCAVDDVKIEYVNPVRQDFSGAGMQSNFVTSRLAGGPGAAFVGGALRLIGNAPQSEANGIGFARAAAGLYARIEADWTLTMRTGGFTFSLLDTARYGASGAMPGGVAEYRKPNLPGLFGAGFNGDNGHVTLHWNGATAQEAASPVAFNDGATHAIALAISPAPKGSAVTVTVDGATAYDRYFIAGLFPFENRPAMAAAGSGGAANAIDVDNISVRAKTQTVNHITAIDYRTGGLTNPQKRTFLSWQGVVNRDLPRVMVLQSDSDYHWLQQLQSYYGIGATILASPWDAFNIPELMAPCNKLVVFNTPEYAWNVALGQAGIRGAAVCEDTGTNLSKFLGAGFTIDTDSDYRGRWATNLEAATWALQNLRPACNPTLMGIWRGLFGLVYESSDLAVQNRAFVWRLDSADSEGDLLIQRDVMASYPPSAGIGEWNKEVVDVRFLGQYGHGIYPQGENNSLYSQLPQWDKQVQKTTTALRTYDAAKKYIFLTFSQGTGINFCQEVNLENWLTMSAPQPGVYARDRYPLAMQQLNNSTPLQQVIPQYFYDTMTTNHWFTGGASGWAYAYPTNMEQSGTFDLYLKRARVCMDNLGTPDVFVNDSQTESDPSHAVLKKLVVALRPRALILKAELHTASPDDDPPEVFAGPGGGCPVFADPVKDAEDVNGVMLPTETMDQIVASASKRQFFYVFLSHSVTMDKVEELCDLLAANHPEIVIMPMDEFVRLYRSIMAPAPPPSWDFTVVADAYANQASPGTNYGSSADNRVRGAATNNQIISYLRFNVSGLQGAVTTATLRLYAKVPMDDTSVYSVADNSWTEMGLNWTTRPLVGAQLASKAPITSGAWHEFNVTGAVTGNGLVSFALQSSQDAGGLNWDSKEGTGNKPALHVETVFPNRPPAFRYNPFFKSGATENAAYSDSISTDASDPDSDPLTYSKAGSPEWLTVAGDGSLLGTPTYSDVGASVFTARVTDGRGASADATMNITVIKAEASAATGWIAY